MAVRLGEQVDRLTEEARITGSAEITREADVARHRFNWYARQVGKIKDLQPNRRKAQRVNELVNRAAAQYLVDVEGRMRVLKMWCRAQGLLTDEQAKKIESHCPPHPGQLQAQLRAGREKAEFYACFNEVLSHCKNAQVARGIWNRHRRRGMDSIDPWCRDLVQAGELGIEWLPGRKMGARLNALRRKMRPGNWANKMMDPVMEDK